MVINIAFVSRDVRHNFIEINDVFISGCFGEKNTLLVISLSIVLKLQNLPTFRCLLCTKRRKRDPVITIQINSFCMLCFCSQDFELQGLKSAYVGLLIVAVKLYSPYPSANRVLLLFIVSFQRWASSLLNIQDHLCLRFVPFSIVQFYVTCLSGCTPKYRTRFVKEMVVL